MDKPIEIKRNKKLALLGILIMVPVAAGAMWLLLGVLFPALPGFLGLKISALAIVGGLCGWVCFMSIKQLAGKKPALVIDKQGVTDDSGPLGVGLVPWEDIVEVKKAQDSLKRTLVILTVRNPGAYINKPGRAFAAARASYFRQFGSPVVISTVNLLFAADTLFDLLKDSLAQMHGKK